jgi:DNA-binding transcriptional ArsR family regulator
MSLLAQVAPVAVDQSVPQSSAVASGVQYLSDHLTFWLETSTLKEMLNQQPGVDVLLHALADPTRRQIVERLGVGPATVTELAAPLPMSLAGVVQHLQILERSGLIATTKVGRVRTCELEVERLDAVGQWISARRNAWERRLDRLGTVLEKGNKK